MVELDLNFDHAQFSQPCNRYAKDFQKFESLRKRGGPKIFMSFSMSSFDNKYLISRNIYRIQQALFMGCSFLCPFYVSSYPQLLFSDFKPIQIPIAGFFSQAKVLGFRSTFSCSKHLMTSNTFVMIYWKTMYQTSGVFKCKLKTYR